MGATACIHLLPPLLQQLRQDHPLLRVGVTTGNTLEIVRAIEENRLDLGLVTLPAAGSALAIAPVMDEEFVFIAAADQQRLFTTLNATELQAHPFIAFGAGSSTRAVIDAWFQAGGVQVEPVMQSGSIEAIKRMVRVGLGYSIIPRMAVACAEDRQGLCVQSLTPVLQRQLAIVMRQDKVLSKGISEIIRLLQTVK